MAAIMELQGQRGVFQIAKPTDIDSVLDVVFIHGLGGDAFTTWQYDEKDPDSLWPYWLFKDVQDISVWTVGYGATKSRWVEDVMSMQDRGQNLLEFLTTKGIGSKPFILITHSMGGLLAKYVLTSAELNKSEKYQNLANNCTDIVFIAVPHDGSDLANIADAGRILFRNNEVITQLKKDSAELRHLNRIFKNYVESKKVRCISFFETKEVRLKKSNFLGIGRLLPFGKIVVTPSSARGDFLQDDNPIPIDADHLSICKIKSRDDESGLLYLGIVELIKKRIFNNNLNFSHQITYKKELNEKIRDLSVQENDLSREIKSKENEITKLRASYNSEHYQLIDWLTKRDRLANYFFEKIQYDKKISQIENIPITSAEVRTFKLLLTLMVEQLEVCLIEGNAEILDEPIFHITFDFLLYEKFFQFLIERIPPHIPISSKEALINNINYLLSRL